MEAYATCVALMTGAALALCPPYEERVTWRAVVIAAVLLALCTLMHTSLVLFTPFVAYAAWRATRSWVKTVASVVIAGGLSLITFLTVALGVRGMCMSETISWILTSDNGYAQRPSATLSFVLTNAGRVFYGVGRTLVHSPAPDRLGSDASFRLSAVGIGFFIVAASIVSFLLIHRVKQEVRQPLRALWAWFVPLLLFGFLFWPSATERWVLVLPVMWLLAALAVASIETRWLSAAFGVFLLGVPTVFNIVTVSEERKLDERTLERSAAISGELRSGDLLLYPGHTWDEYVGFYEDVPVERFIIASFAGEERGDAEALLARLRTRSDATHERGGRVVAVRVFDVPDSHHGWSLLRAMDIPRDDVLAVLADYETRRLIRDPVGVWEIRSGP